MMDLPVRTLKTEEIDGTRFFLKTQGDDNDRIYFWEDENGEQVEDIFFEIGDLEEELPNV